MGCNLHQQTLAVDNKWNMLYILICDRKRGAGSQRGKNLHCDKQPAAHSVHSLVEPHGEMHSTVYLWHHLLFPFHRDQTFSFFKAKKAHFNWIKNKSDCHLFVFKNAKGFRQKRVISWHLAINFVWQIVCTVQAKQQT